MRLFRSLTVIAFICVCLADNAAGSANNAPDILALNYTIKPNHTQLIVELSDKTAYKYFSLRAPERVVIDIKNINNIQTQLSRLVVNSDLVNSVRSARRNQTSLRLVLDMATKKYTKKATLEAIESGGYRLVIDILGENNNKASSEQATDATLVTQRAKLEQGSAVQSPTQRLNALFADYRTLASNIQGILLDKWQNSDVPLPVLMNRYNVNKLTLNTFAQQHGLLGVGALDKYLLIWSVISQEKIQALLQRRPQDWSLMQAEKVLFSILQNPAQRTRQQATLLVTIGFNTFETMGVFHLLTALEASGHPELIIDFPLHSMLIKVLPDAVYERMPRLPITSQYAVWLMHQYSIKELANMGTSKSVLRTAVKQLSVDNIETPEQLVNYFTQQKNSANRIELEPTL